MKLIYVVDCYLVFLLHLSVSMPLLPFCCQVTGINPQVLRKEMLFLKIDSVCPPFAKAINDKEK